VSLVDRTAEAKWSGDLKSGRGTVRVRSGSFEGPYSFTSRFESGSGTNPEELLRAAHAGCFSMALSHALAMSGHVPTSVTTKATVHLAKVGAGFAITGIDLSTRGVVPGLSAAEFQRFAEDTKANCIVSKALSAVPMRLDAQLAGA
jgi:osmotically inducible protein OsmC